MPQQTILDIPAEQQAAMLRELRRWRYGLLLNLHILLLSARGRTPSEIADFLFCSRSSVYRAVAAFRAGKFDRLWQPTAEEPSAAPPESRFAATPAAAHRAAAAPLRLVSDALSVAPPWRSPSRPTPASRTRAKRFAANSTRKGGSGSGRNSGRVMMTRSGRASWRGFGRHWKTCGLMRLSSGATNWICSCFRRSALSGCARADRSK